MREKNEGQESDYEVHTGKKSWVDQWGQEVKYSDQQKCPNVLDFAIIISITSQINYIKLSKYYIICPNIAYLVFMFDYVIKYLNYYFMIFITSRLHWDTFACYVYWQEFSSSSVEIMCQCFDKSHVTCL